MAGCARQGRATGPVAPPGGPLVLRIAPRLPNFPPGYAFDYFAAVPGLAARFNATHAGLAIAATPGPVRGRVSVYELCAVVPLVTGGATAHPLNVALQSSNFNPATIQSGALDAFRDAEGRLRGLPVSQAPLAVRWRRDVFAAAGLAAPAADWTIADFEGACAQIAALIRSGRAPDLLAPLYPVFSYGNYWGIGAMPAWWGSFAWGYGGSLTDGGAFAPDDAALRGLGVLLDLSARYAPARRHIPASTAADLQRLPQSFGLAFDFWSPHDGSLLADIPTAPAMGPPVTFGPEWSWARLPVFPVRPVVGTMVSGEGLTGPGAGRREHPGQLDAAVDALLWLYGAGAQALLQAWGAVPVAADAAAQRRFWGSQPVGSRVVGDWANFVAFGGGAWAAPAAGAMLNALEAAAFSPADPTVLAAQVGEAARKVNARLPASGA